MLIHIDAFDSFGTYRFSIQTCYSDGISTETLCVAPRFCLMKSVSKETEEERREAEQFRFHTGRGLSSAHAPATTACDASRGDWGNGNMATGHLRGGVGELYAKGLGK